MVGEGRERSVRIMGLESIPFSLGGWQWQRQREAEIRILGLDTKTS